MHNDAWIMVPVVVVVPRVIASVPPLMVFIPAALSFVAKLVPSSVRLRTVLAMALNLTVKSGLRVFDVLLAPGARVRMRELRSGHAHEHQKRGQDYGGQSSSRQAWITAVLSCNHSILL